MLLEGFEELTKTEKINANVGGWNDLLNETPTGGGGFMATGATNIAAPSDGRSTIVDLIIAALKAWF